MNILKFYRLIDWRHKIAGSRVMAYPLFGFLISHDLDTYQQIGFTISIAGLVAVSYALNDYWDWKINNESNYLASLINSKKISSRQAELTCLIPALFIILGLIAVSSLPSLYIFGLVAALVLVYSWPPIRLKDIRWLGSIAPPLSMTLVFLASYLLTAELNSNVLALSVLLFLFQLQAELFHIIDDSLHEKKSKLSLDRAIWLLKTNPLFSFVFSAVVSLLDPIFIVSMIANIIRYRSALSFKISKITSIRKNFHRPEWAIYEFAAYGLISVLGGGYFSI